MKRLVSWMVACAVACAGVSTVWAQQQLTPAATAPVNVASAATPNSATPVNPALPLPPAIDAKAYLLLDLNSGQILAQNNADMQVDPASLTKLMTAYLVFDALQNKRITLDQKLTISARARNMEGSRMFVEMNSQVRVEDLIKGMIVQSGNDATVALAEGVGGTVENFVNLMNQQAQLLGMQNTTFKNPEGLTEPGHVTTARDLSILASRLIADFPQEYKYYSIKEFEYTPDRPNAAPIPQKNRNLLLFWDPTVDGLKTGHTDAAGYCLVASSARDFPNLSEKRRLISVVLGAKGERERAQETQKLLNWGFVAWDDVQLFSAGQAVVTPKVWKGSVSETKLGPANVVVASVPHGMAGNLKSSASYTDPLVAPLKRGQEAGELRVTLSTPSGDIALGVRKLVVLENVDEAGFFGRLWDGFWLWVR